MKPQRTNGNDTLKRARHPAAVDVSTPLGPVTTVLPEKPVTNPKDELKLQAANEKPTQRNLRRAKLLGERAYILQAGGMAIGDVADELGVSRTTLLRYMTLHRRDVEERTIDDKLDQIAVPLAADNLIHGLLAGDKDYTLETLKGRGKFRRHGEAVDVGRTAMPALRIEFVMEGVRQVEGSSGTAGGNIQWPRGVQGTVIDSKALPAHDSTPASGNGSD